MSQKWGTLILCVSFGLFAAGCPRGHGEYSEGQRAENLQDYDAALSYYEKAVKAEPHNAAYRIRLNQARFEAGEFHVKRGLEMRKRGELDGAAIEFQKALGADPSSSIAEQELSRTAEMLAEREHRNQTSEPPTDHNQQPLASMPPEIKPLSRAPINYKASSDAKVVFDTIGKLAGLTVVYDPDFPARRITVDLVNVTLEQALEIVQLESKAFVKPVTENIIFVIPDQPQKRRDYEEQVVRTFYISNTIQAQDLTEIVTGLRQLLDLNRIQQLNSQNAIIVRDTPDKLMLAEKMIRDIDKAKPEVVVQVEVLEARTDRLRDLDILPGQTASIAINPNNTTSSSSSTSTSNSGINLNQLRHLNSTDYVVTLPSVTANAVLTDTNTRIIQNPEVRSVDGQNAKLKIGDRIPIATGSFSSGIGIAGGTAGGINPLVNTQFTYQDVGVTIDLTPRVHPNREVSLKLKVQVRRETEIHAPAPPPVTPQQQPQTNPAPPPTAPASAAQGAAAKLRFEPPSLSLKAGQTTTIGVVIENVNDLFSIPLLLQYNPAVISVEEVRHGGFLSGGTQEIAIVHQPFKDKGQSIISATRGPNTAGVSGSGTLLGIVIKGLAPGSSNLSIVQVNAKDSQQNLIPLITSEATVQVQP